MPEIQFGGDTDDSGGSNVSSLIDLLAAKIAKEISQFGSFYGSTFKWHDAVRFGIYKKCA